jgi:hypothetical protein
VPEQHRQDRAGLRYAQGAEVLGGLDDDLQGRVLERLLEGRHHLPLPLLGFRPAAARLLGQAAGRRRAHRRRAALHQEAQPVERPAVGDAGQGQHGGALHVGGAVVAEPQEQVGQGPLTDRVGPVEQFRGPGDRQRAHRRVVVLDQGLDVAQPVGGGQPAVELLVQAQHLRPGPLQVALQAVRPAGLERQAGLQPALLRQVLVPPPPVAPAADLQTVVEARQVGERGRGVVPQDLLGRGQLVQQDFRGGLAAAAPERPQRRLAHGHFEAGVLGNGLEAQDGRGVGQLGEGGRGGRAQGRRAAQQGREEVVAEARVALEPDGGGQRQEDLGCVRLAQPLVDDVGGVGERTLHEE